MHNLIRKSGSRHLLCKRHVTRRVLNYTFTDLSSGVCIHNQVGPAFSVPSRVKGPLNDNTFWHHSFFERVRESVDNLSRKPDQLRMHATISGTTELNIKERMIRLVAHHSVSCFNRTSRK